LHFSDLDELKKCILLRFVSHRELGNDADKKGQYAVYSLQNRVYLPQKVVTDIVYIYVAIVSSS
jgi:hypothetical protein